MPIASHKTAQGLWPSQVALGSNGGKQLTTSATTQGTAVLCADEYNEFGTVAASGACILPTAQQAGGLQAGDEVWVVNMGANALAVFPQIGGYIGAGAQNASVSVAVGSYAIFVMTLSGKWVQK